MRKESVVGSNYMEYLKKWQENKDHHQQSHRRRRRPLSDLKKALKLNTKEFCLNTSLHGLKFLAYNQLQFLEK